MSYASEISRMSDVSIDPTIRKKAEKIIENTRNNLAVIDEADDEVERLNLKNL